MVRANDKVYIVNSLLILWSLPYFPRCFRLEFFFCFTFREHLFSASVSGVTGLASARAVHVEARLPSVGVRRIFFFYALFGLSEKKQYFRASGLSFLWFRNIPSTFWASCAIFQGIAWFYTTWWVALQSVCAFRGVCITQPLPNLGRRALERNFKDFPRWDTKFEPLSWFIVDFMRGKEFSLRITVLLLISYASHFIPFVIKKSVSTTGFLVRNFSLRVNCFC